MHQRLWWNMRMWIVTVKSWPLDCDQTHQMKPRRMRYKTHQNASRWIVIGQSWCILNWFNLDCYNSLRSTVEIKMHPVNSISPCTPLHLNEDQQLRIHTRSDAPQATTSPPLLDCWSLSDWTGFDYATSPTRFRKFRKIVLNYKNQFLIPENP